MLESQQKNLLAHPERRLLSLNIDSGGVQSRRVLERILAHEQAPAAVAA
jgi:vanillate O-demethylase monooxygenase subunit